MPSTWADWTHGFGAALTRLFESCRPNVPALAFALVTVPAVLPASIDLTFLTVGTGRTITGSGTGTGSLDFGTVSLYGPLPTNVTRSTTATNYTLTTNVGVRVTKSGESSTTYTFRARIVTASSFTWRVNNTNMTTAFTTVYATQNYNTTYTIPLRIIILIATDTGLDISQQLEYLAIAN